MRRFDSCRGHFTRVGRIRLTGAAWWSELCDCGGWLTLADLWVLVEDLQAPAAKKSLGGLEHSTGGVERLAGVGLVDAR